MPVPTPATFIIGAVIAVMLIGFIVGGIYFRIHSRKSTEQMSDEAIARPISSYTNYTLEENQEIAEKRGYEVV